MDNAIKARNEAYAAFEHIPAKHQARAVAIARRAQESFDNGNFASAAHGWEQMMKLAVMKNPIKKTGFEKDATEDIQHDLALFMADGQDFPEAREELKRRGAKIPHDARMSKYGGVDYKLNPQGPASKFEHETVKPYPALRRAGLTKIRTITTPSGHRVRIAFPPGRRRPGSGQVQGILHPAGENPVVPFVRPASRSKIYASPATREEIARAAATDAGNESMRAGGRRVWSIEDFNIAARKYNGLVGAPLNPPLSNPRRTKIYQHCLKIFASKKGMHHKCDPACKAHDHNYVHKFEHENICIYGLPDGSILIEG